MKAPSCALCDEPGGRLVFQGPSFRLIRADEAGFPAFYRLVWADHVAEFSDLPRADRQLCMDAIVQVEQAMRRRLKPAKINLASLGNVVPHLHWHIIARFAWDSHFPAPVWAPAQRQADPEALAALRSACILLDSELVTLLTPGL